MSDKEKPAVIFTATNGLKITESKTGFYAIDGIDTTDEEKGVAYGINISNEFDTIKQLCITPRIVALNEFTKSNCDKLHPLFEDYCSTKWAAWIDKQIQKLSKEHLTVICEEIQDVLTGELLYTRTYKRDHYDEDHLWKRADDTLACDAKGTN